MTAVCDWQADIKSSHAPPNSALFPLNSAKCNLCWQNTLRILVFHWSLFNIREHTLTYYCLFSQKVTLSKRYTTSKGIQIPTPLCMMELHLSWASVVFVPAITATVSTNMHLPSFSKRMMILCIFLLLMVPIVFFTVFNNWVIWGRKLGEIRSL